MTKYCSKSGGSSYPYWVMVSAVKTAFASHYSFFDFAYKEYTVSSEQNCCYCGCSGSRIHLGVCDAGVQVSPGLAR
jgi:hypothetical protein